MSLMHAIETAQESAVTARSLKTVVALRERIERPNPRDSKDYAHLQTQSPLYDIRENPSRYRNVRYSDSEIVIIDDEFGKSPDHVVLIPRDTSLNETADLRAKHLPLLYRLRREVKAQVSRMMALDPDRIPMFLIGFHIIPTLFPLHCHVLDWSISTGHAHHQRHWRIMFSNMFISLDAVIEELEQTGQMLVDAEAYRHDWRTKPLRCPVCTGPQPRWEEEEVAAIANHWFAHIATWRLTRTLPPGIGPYRQWLPTLPVLLLIQGPTKKVVHSDDLDRLRRKVTGLEIQCYRDDEWAKIPKYLLDQTTICIHPTEQFPSGIRLPRLKTVEFWSGPGDDARQQKWSIRLACIGEVNTIAIVEWLATKFSRVDHDFGGQRNNKLQPHKNGRLFAARP